MLTLSETHEKNLLERRLSIEQIRLDYPFNHTKYIWLSSINDKMGTSSGSPIHFVGNPRDEIVFLTEGPLKGDIASFLSGLSFACVPGVE